MSLVALLAAASMAATQSMDERTRSDVRCFLALSAVVGDEGAKASHQAAQLGAMYYIGKIDGHTPQLNLEQALAEETPKITDADMPQLIETCSAVLGTRGKELIRIGTKLEGAKP